MSQTFSKPNVMGIHFPCVGSLCDSPFLSPSMPAEHLHIANISMGLIATNCISDLPILFDVTFSQVYCGESVLPVFEPFSVLFTLI